MKSILVTGGAGYLGSQVIRDLLKRCPNYKIIIYDNLSRGRIEFLSSLIKRFKKRLIIIPNEKADIRDIQNFSLVLDKYHPKIVINLAAIVDAFSTTRKGKDEECRIVNYLSAVNLAKTSKEKGVEIFIQQSSVSMYSQGNEIKEDSKKSPLTEYGRSKYLAEEEILKLSSNLFKCCALRAATFVGYTSGFAYQTIINLMCIRSVYNIPFILFESALENKKTFLDVKDQSRAIFFAIKNIHKQNRESYNVTSFHTTLKEVLKELNKITKKKDPYLIKKESTINQQVYTINSDKIKQIGFFPRGNLQEVIKTTMKMLLKQDKLFKKLHKFS